VAMVATLLDTLPAPFANGVDKVYHQLKDIHGTTTAQQVENPSNAELSFFFLKLEPL
jgi:hypothetical protein